MPEIEHPYQHCRPLTDEEYAALKADIDQHGVLDYVHVDETGAILVGHHRARAAAELGIDYPRHVVYGLSEQQKHEYAVRLESLGRSKDMDTKRWTALNLWHDPNVRLNQKRIAELVGVGKSTVNDWIRDDDEQRGTQAPTAVNPAPDLPPTEASTVQDAIGRQRPTTYAPRQPAPADPADPTVGDVREEIRAAFDEEGLAEDEALRRHMQAMARVRITWLRFISENPPGVFLDGLDRPGVASLIGDLDRFTNWIAQARAGAVEARRPRRVV
jgi:ParB-like chromosome segregation protein Spo0J